MTIAIPYTVSIRPDTGLNNGRLGIWLFLASEVMLFGALFATYILLRTGAETWPAGRELLNVPLATLNTVVLIVSSVTMVMAWASLARNKFGTFRIWMGATILFTPSSLFMPTTPKPYRPLSSGGRFSKNACTASLWSSVFRTCSWATWAKSKASSNSMERLLSAIISLKITS